MGGKRADVLSPIAPGVEAALMVFGRTRCCSRKEGTFKRQATVLRYATGSAEREKRVGGRSWF